MGLCVDKCPETNVRKPETCQREGHLESYKLEKLEIFSTELIFLLIFHIILFFFFFLFFLQGEISYYD